MPGSFEAWLLLRSLGSFGLRFERQCQNAMALAVALADHPRVRVVRYPGLAADPSYPVAAQQMRRFGGLVSVELADADAVQLQGELVLPGRARGVVLFAHGSGSSRLSPRNRFVAQALNEAGIATLLFDLLTPNEDYGYSIRFDIGLLTSRLLSATDWVLGDAATLVDPTNVDALASGLGVLVLLQKRARERMIATASA